MYGQCTDQTTDKDTQADKDHICLVGRAVNVTHLLGSRFHFELCSGQFKDITGVDHCLRKYRNVDSCPLDAADTDSMHEFLCADGRDFFSGERTVSNHDGKRLCRKVEQLGIDHFRTDPVFFADGVFTATAQYHFIARL